MRPQTEYYKDKLQQGLYYQDFVMEQLYKAGIPLLSYSSKEYQHLVGENMAGIEIKNDTRYKETGNIYIETSEKSNELNEFYVPSGIYRNDNTWLYLIGDFKTIFVFSKKQLILLDKSSKLTKIVKRNPATSKGFLLPVIEAEKSYAIKIIKI